MHSIYKDLKLSECLKKLNCVTLQDLTLDAEKDPYSQWNFQDLFNEDCIVLDPVSVLPVQYEITNCLLPISRGQKILK